MLSTVTPDPLPGNAGRSPIPAWYCARILLLGVMLSARGPMTGLGQEGAAVVVPPGDTVTGPTIRLDFDHDASPGNPVASFMYFVPLISPEPVCCITSPRNTQAARVLSAKRKSTSRSFVAICEFEFTGDGTERSIFDLAPSIRRHEQRLKAGAAIGRQLSSITVEGQGRGTVEVEGTISNSVETVTEVRLRFNAHGKTSPVSIELCELHYVGDECQRFHEIVARVNTLTFRRKPGPPKMEVTVASVKNKGAGNGLWRTIEGTVKSVAVNLLIDPLTVETVGHRAMLDFGRAVASGMSMFTFPLAKNLKVSDSPGQQP